MSELQSLVISIFIVALMGLSFTAGQQSILDDYVCTAIVDQDDNL